MNHLHTAKTGPMRSTVQVVDPQETSQWEKLPPKRQHELIIALTTMLVKRLPDQRILEEGGDE